MDLWDRGVSRRDRDHGDGAILHRKERGQMVIDADRASRETALDRLRRARDHCRHYIKSENRGGLL